VRGFIELSDPDHLVPFPIVNEFDDGATDAPPGAAYAPASTRILTGADFDIESFQRAADGTLWFGDEFGPFLLHTDADGRLLEPPIAVPDPDHPGEVIRSPQNPGLEESTPVRLMNAFRAHARAHGGRFTPVVSPWDPMLVDGDPATFVGHREAPPPGSGVAPAASEIFDVAALHTAGYPVVPYTIDDATRMQKLLALHVDGLISDRPDLLYATIAAYDANGDGVAGDYLDADGLIDIRKVDAQGHRGGRDLRPENTLPAFEAGLDNLVTTLELDIGLTRDLVPVIDHDPHVQAQKCRRLDGAAYEASSETLVHDLFAWQLQTQFVCDKVFRGPSQANDPALSPVAQAYRQAHPWMRDIYVMPTLYQLFDFVDFYADYYTRGAGASQRDAARRAKNAARVRFNIETKLNPRAEYVARTVGPDELASVVGYAIASRGLAARADVQSFDFRSLLRVQEWFPAIRTVYLFGDFPRFADPSIAGSDDGTNLQPDLDRDNTPWMAGLRWPYRVTARTQPPRARRSGGFEGMAISPDGKKLYPLLEQPLVGDDAKTLRIFEYDVVQDRWVGQRATYTLDARGTNIGDFILFTPTRGLVIERDGSQGDLSGWKQIFRVDLGAPGAPVRKRSIADLQNIWDPFQISLPAAPGDVGLGTTFSFPFTTIEDVVVLGPTHIGVLNDNNFPFSVGRHVGSSRPDDEELIVLDVGAALLLP
jgi:glycerophosphoryl diester phosphodiesterase